MQSDSLLYRQRIIKIKFDFGSIKVLYEMLQIEIFSRDFSLIKLLSRSKSSYLIMSTE